MGLSPNFLPTGKSTYGNDTKYCGRGINIDLELLTRKLVVKLSMIRSVFCFSSSSYHMGSHQMIMFKTLSPLTGHSLPYAFD